MQISDYHFRRADRKDAAAIVSIYNYFVKNSFAAYSENVAGAAFFDEQLGSNYPFYVIEEDEKMVGFGLLRPYGFHEALKRAATAKYFILPDHTRRGLGHKLLCILTEEAKKIGVDTLLVHISSRNMDSLKFHQRNGFKKCGRFKRVGTKFGSDFDIVWMQKFI
jgi:L-amino acid N-acyltransferase YncA